MTGKSDQPNPTPLLLEGEDKVRVQGEICALIAEGKTLSEILRQEGMPGRRTVYDWITSDEAFAVAMDVARDMGADAIADKTKALIDEDPQYMTTEGGNKKVDPGWVSWRSKQIDHHMKLLAKWHPKKYGDKVTQELTGPNGGPIQITDMTDDELARIAAGSGT